MCVAVIFHWTDLFSLVKTLPACLPAPLPLPPTVIIVLIAAVKKYGQLYSF